MILVLKVYRVTLDQLVIQVFKAAMALLVDLVPLDLKGYKEILVLKAYKE